MTIDGALAVIAEVKRLRPEAVTVVGGPHVTFCAAETLAACPALDVVVIGEGEETVVELGRAVRQAQAWPGCGGSPFATASTCTSQPAGGASAISTGCPCPRVTCSRSAATVPSGCRSA